MTNQTIIFCRLGVAGTGMALVTADADHFQHDNITSYINFEKQPVVVVPDTHDDTYWYTLQVNYYDPAIQE